MKGLASARPRHARARRGTCHAQQRDSGTALALNEGAGPEEDVRERRLCYPPCTECTHIQRLDSSR